MNTGTVLVGQKMPKEERYEWLKNTVWASSQALILQENSRA